MNIENYIQNLKKQLEEPLPGFTAQKRMIPAHRANTESPNSLENAVQSAVLLLLFPFKFGLGVVLMERTADNTVHSKQISLPGGKTEKHDSSPEQTALRETWEEIGVEPQLVKLLGKLTPLFIPVSNFSVQPVLGFIEKQPQFVLNTREVEQVLVEELTQIQQSVHETEVVAGKGQILHVPAYKVGGKTVWGATAMILAEFFEIHKFALKDKL